MRDCQSKNILILQLSSFQQENVCVALFLAMSVLTFNDLLANVFFLRMIERVLFYMFYMKCQDTMYINNNKYRCLRNTMS